MRKTISFLVVLVCLVFAGQAQSRPMHWKFSKKQGKTALLRSQSQQTETFSAPARAATVIPAYLPTKAYRARPDGTPMYKCEYAYDAYGNMTSKKMYEWTYNWEEQEYKYVLTDVATSAWYRYPNGEFVKTLDQNGPVKYSAAYDSKGLCLWRQYENNQSNAWILDFREEAIVNANGIRTGMKAYNEETEQMEVVNGLTFDGKGRITRIEDRFGWESYTWDDNDLPSGFAFHEGTDLEEEDNIVLTNITGVLNSEYVDSYSRPFIDKAFLNTGIGAIPEPDYTLHTWVYNADGTVSGLPVTIRTTVNAEQSEIVVIVTIGTIVTERETISIPDNYGSYSVIFEGYTEEGKLDYYDEKTVAYNVQGELIREYYRVRSNEYEYEYNSEFEITYVREYDGANRPIKTVAFLFGEEMYEETYDAWTTLGGTGIIGVENQSVTVYPNPVTESFRLTGLTGTTAVSISDIAGKIVLRQSIASGEAVPVGHLPQGVYFVNAAGKTMKIMKAK